MNSHAEVKKFNPIVISADVFEMLDPFHRAAAEVLQEQGEVIIEKCEAIQ